MKHPSLFSIFLLSAALTGCGQKQEASQPTALSLPHLEQRGSATQLIVNDQPWLVLGCELGNSTSSSRAYMAPYWDKLKAAGVNTVLAVVSWEQLEPEEGVFDFTVVDHLITDARAHQMKLALLWFGSWKNGFTSYTPTWVKRDTARFPLSMTPEGKKLPILSTFGEETCKADAKAYARLMQHIKDIDATEQTVVMMQMENEVGLHGHTRDYCPAANAAYEKLEGVPDSIINRIPKNIDRIDEAFMAWHYAAYMDKIAAAGKEVYDIPVFVNAWIVQPEDKHPGNYPSGGPQAQNHPIYRAAAPHIDLLSPDIYLNDFPAITRLYTANGNPLFVPESRDGQAGAANAAYAIGQCKAIGYSPFGFESKCDAESNQTFSQLYHKLGSIQQKVLQAQAEDRIVACWLKGSDPYLVKDTVLLGDTRIVAELVSSGMRNGGAPQLTGGTYDPDACGYVIAIQEEDHYLFLGSNARVTFLPAEGEETVGLAKVAEGDFNEAGEWVEGRWLNGDQIQLRYDILYAIDEGFSGQGLNFQHPSPEFISVELFRY